MRRSLAPVAVLAAVALAGCGLALQAPDLFLVTRTGQGAKLTILVNYGGTIRCNGGRPKTIPDSLLVQARSLPGQLYPDAAKKLDPPSPPRSVYRYQVKVQRGTFSFPDTAAEHRPELAKLEQFMLQAEPLCG
jgi:hypothetical protein